MPDHQWIALVRPLEAVREGERCRRLAMVLGLGLAAADRRMTSRQLARLLTSDALGYAPTHTASEYQLDLHGARAAGAAA
ncbi:hypothetical protein [Streptomyces celluloflavus]|nr:hypothetical protein OG717_15735 [Streptomyces celluloflavus]